MDSTFTLLPLHLDPTTKTLSSPSADSTLSSELLGLNALHRLLVPLSSQTPPAPLPVNPKRSAQIQKMREQGNASLRKGNPPAIHEAIKLYTYGVEMALGRPSWEPSGLMKEEASLLYANRAQAYMGVQMWPEGAADAGASVELKRTGNGKAWWRRGRCLVEMGRWEDARAWVDEGGEVEGNEGELKELAKEIEKHMDREVLGK